MQEERSFLPRKNSQKEQAVNIDPITSMRPTNRELGNGINQVHYCFEDHKKKNARALQHMSNEVNDIKNALGISGGRRRRVSGLSSTQGAFFRTVGATTASIGGIAIIWKLIAIAAPTLLLLFKVINDAILGGRL